VKLLQERGQVRTAALDGARSRLSATDTSQIERFQ